MTTVNINIKNCNCGSSGSDSGGTGGGSDDQGYDNEPSDGTDIPRGFTQSAITGRPCKVAVWCYDWVNAWIQVIGENPWFISTLVQIALSAFARTFFNALKWAVGSLLGFVAGILDVVPGDEIPMTVAGGVTAGLLEFGGSYAADKLTESMIADSATKFQADRATFICMIAKGQNAAESKKNVEAHLVSEGYPGPIQWLINSLLNDFYNVVFYTPNWWPGFDDYLTGITEVCCDGLTDGKLIEPGSAQACRGANFVLDGLVAVLTSADMYVQNYSRTAYNSLSGTEAAMLANVQANYLVPDSITGKAWSWQLSQAELARYMYAKLSGNSWLTPTTGGVTSWEMGRLGAHLQTEIAICELRDAATAQAAYELLSGAIDAWLTANVTDQALAGHIRLFCQGLIHPSGAYIGVLFAESADLAGFAGSSDCEECGDSSCGDPGTFVLHDPRFSNVGDYTANYIGENTVVITTGSVVPGYGSRFSFRFGSNLESRRIKHAEVVGTMSGDTASGYASLIDNIGGAIYLGTDGSFSSSQLNTITDLYTSQNPPICISAINGSYISPGTILEFEFFPV